MWTTMLSGRGMQQWAMHNATIQKTTIFDIGVYVLVTVYKSNRSVTTYMYLSAFQRKARKQ